MFTFISRRRLNTDKDRKMDEKEQKKHRKKQSGGKLNKKQKRHHAEGGGTEEDARRRNPKAFSVQSAVRMARTFHRYRNQCHESGNQDGVPYPRIPPVSPNAVFVWVAEETRGNPITNLPILPTLLTTALLGIQGS